MRDRVAAVTLACLSADPRVMRRILERRMPPFVAASWRSAAEEILPEASGYNEVEVEWRETETNIGTQAPRDRS